MFTPFEDQVAEPAIRGFLHIPSQPTQNAIVLTHGAGANCQSKLLFEISSILADAGLVVLRFDLPFRLARPHGPPFPGGAKRDRDGIQRASALMRKQNSGRVFVGGHSYGGRQATMLLADNPAAADGLLLLSYPLHPPRKPSELRTEHFPKLTEPAFFVHGTRDPFGSIREMQSALQLIPGPHALYEVDNSGHDLLPKRTAVDFLIPAIDRFLKFVKL
jgi:predicted alpha/beta-hydrolase family hydrolase